VIGTKSAQSRAPSRARRADDQAYDPDGDMHDEPPTPRERGATVVEYVGLGALSTLLVSGVASALGSSTGTHLAEAIVRRLVEVISTGG
jgi:hypothetical protein